jgi:hypothetical protein
MPGIGVRIWNPQYRSGNAEIPMTIVNTTVTDSLALNGTTIPFKCATGNFMVRIVGRANAASRPLGITVKWGAISMVQKVLFAESGAGGTFVGIWTLAGITPATANVVFTCGANEAGCAAIRVGEIGGVPAQLATAGVVGPTLTFAKNASSNPLLVVAGVADEAGFPITCAQMDHQWGVKVPAKTSLPNRNDGLAAYFGLSYASSSDNKYTFAKTGQTPSVLAIGAIGAIELRL